MRLRSLAVAFFSFLTICSASRAVDDRDIGTYLLVDVKGEVTSKAIRLTRFGAQYMLEDRRPDGSWLPVTCTSACTLNASEQAHVERFFSAATLLQISPQCVHNKAFAFCAYSLKADAGFRGYLFVALTEAQPIALRLARVDPSK